VTIERRLIMTHKPILTFTHALRKKLIVIFMTTLIGLQGMYVVFLLPEIWPFSSYPMFSRGWGKKNITYTEIKGVTAKGREFSLDISKYFYPFNRTKLTFGIWRSGLYPLKRQKYRDEIFRYLLDQYAVTKKAGYHEGPPIVALRLYSNTWNWSQKPPEKVVPRTFLIYSTAMGQSQGEK